MLSRAIPKSSIAAYALRTAPTGVCPACSTDASLRVPSPGRSRFHGSDMTIRGKNENNGQNAKTLLFRLRSEMQLS